MDHRRSWDEGINKNQVREKVEPRIWLVRCDSIRECDGNWMHGKRIFFALIGLICVNALATEPSATPSPSASPSESAASAVAQSVSELSAQRAAMERSRIYHVGVDYSKWLD